MRVNAKIRADWPNFSNYDWVMKSSWELKSARNKFSELVTSAQHQGAQTITRHGKPVAVVLSVEAYSRLHPAEKLVDILRDCPVKDWRIERDLTLVTRNTGDFPEDVTVLNPWE